MLTIKQVYFHRKHPRTPELISHADVKVLQDFHKRAEAIKATVMVFKYCNGGTLAAFSDAFAQGSRDFNQLTESILWHVFAAQLETIMFLHGCTPSLGNMDSHMNNVFLHFPESSKFPEFYTGDLGHLKVMEKSVWRAVEDGQFQKVNKNELKALVPEYVAHLKTLHTDLTYVDTNLYFLAGLLPADGEGEADFADAREWSAEWSQCRQLLKSILWKLERSDMSAGGARSKSGKGHKKGGPTQPLWYKQLHDLKAMVTSYAEQSRSSDPQDTDFSWARDAPSRPRLWVDRDMLLSLCQAWNMPGPFKVAKVDPETLTIVDIEDTDFGMHNPQSLGRTHSTFYEGGWSYQELIVDPLICVERIRWYADSVDLEVTNEEELDSDDDCDDKISHSEIADLLLRVPTVLKRRNYGLVADFGGAWKFRNISIERIRDDGSLIVELGDEDYLITEWKDDRRYKGSQVEVVKSTSTARGTLPSSRHVARTKTRGRAEDTARERAWYRCQRHRRMHRVGDRAWKSCQQP